MGDFVPERGGAMGTPNPDSDAVERYRASAQPGPVVMINLFKFKTPEDQPRLLEGLRELAGPLVAEVGGERIYAGSAGPEFSAGEDWDLLLMVRYPDFEAVASIATNPVWLEGAGKLREETLADSRFLLTYPDS